MEHAHYYIESTDGTRLFIREWKPDKPAVARIIMVHGFSEHSGRYNDWAERFASHNIRVIAPDLRGHGKSKGIRGHTPGFRQYLKDMDQLLHLEQIPDSTPTFLYGQSLGGGSVINYAIHRSDGFQGIIATSPWLKLSTEPKAFKLLLSRGLKIIAPRSIRNSKLDVNYLSHDQEVIKQYEEDPLTHRTITPHLFFGARKAGYKAIRQAHKIKHPLLIMHGTGDKITSVKASRQLVLNAQKAGVDARYVPWEGLYHELHHETQKDQVFQTIINWVEENIKNGLAYD